MPTSVPLPMTNGLSKTCLPGDAKWEKGSRSLPPATRLFPKSYSNTKTIITGGEIEIKPTFDSAERVAI